MLNHYHHKRQQGGTLVGIIIGLVVGLGIAVVVAVAITKTPMPFSNKGKQEKPPEPTAGQIADPNKLLYGNKGPIKDAAKEFTKESEGVISGAVPSADKKAPAADQPAADKSKKTDKPDAKGPDGKTPPDAKDASKDATEDKWLYYLQVGAFRESADAEGSKAKLALLGVEAHISERQSENGLLYRVRLGPFSQVEAMNRVRGKLSENGVDVAVVRSAK